MRLVQGSRKGKNPQSIVCLLRLFLLNIRIFFLKTQHQFLHSLKIQELKQKPLFQKYLPQEQHGPDRVGCVLVVLGFILQFLSYKYIHVLQRN